MKQNVTDHTLQKDRTIILSKSTALEILHYMEDVEDEGPVCSGWKSQKLVDCIGELQDAIDNAISRITRTC